MRRTSGGKRAWTLRDRTPGRYGTDLRPCAAGERDTIISSAVEGPEGGITPVVLGAGPWWAFVGRGVIGIVFGLLTFFVPGLALLTLVTLFGAWAVVDGVFNIAAALHRTAERPERWRMLLAGVVGLLAGLLTFLIPGLTALSSPCGSARMHSYSARFSSGSA